MKLLSLLGVMAMLACFSAGKHGLNGSSGGSKSLLTDSINKQEGYVVKYSVDSNYIVYYRQDDLDMNKRPEITILNLKQDRVLVRSTSYHKAEWKNDTLVSFFKFPGIIRRNTDMNTPKKEHIEFIYNINTGDLQKAPGANQQTF